MFVLISRLKNEIIRTDSESKRDRLIDLGYTIVEEKLNLEKMKVEDLEKYAADNGIDLSGCANKTEKIAKIKESVAG